MNRMHQGTAGLLLGLVLWSLARAQDITAFENGYITFDIPDTNRYYRIEFRPNLTGPEGWDNSLPVNIKTHAATVTVPVGVFYRVAGRDSSWPVAPVPKTGKTTNHCEGDDAWWSTNGIGVAWPEPRFVVQSDTNVVLDTLTGLMWVRDVNLDATNNFGWKTWDDAITYCNTLDHGGYSDWRLPNVKELQSLVDFGTAAPALPSGHPFTGFSSLDSYVYHFSSTLVATTTNLVWFMKVMTGEIVFWDRNTGYAWPVRGGE